MKNRLRPAWVVALIVVPLLIIGGLTANYTGLIHLPAASAAMASDKTAALNWSDIKVVSEHHLPPFKWNVEKLPSLPAEGNARNAFSFDLRAKDLSQLDLTQKGQLLLNWATFDAGTVWPAKMPADFSPSQVMELAKDPGLGLRQLHQQGVTGKGVHVAILDQALLWNHQEYAGRVIKYTEVGRVAPQPEMHGAAVTSLLAGKSIGVAPEAQVTYYAVQVSKDRTTDQRTFLYIAATINKILDDNKTLPPDQRIRVISASIGASPKEEGYAAVNDAYKRAMQEGVLIVSTDMEERYHYGIMGLNRDTLKDPNDYKSYSPGLFWSDYFFQNQGRLNTGGAKLIYAPMDSRTTAAPTGTSDYAFYRQGGLSWSVPWMAGMYALVCQVDPKVTPEEFLKVAYDTGDTVNVSNNGKPYEMGPIMNPAKIIAHFQK